MTNVFLYMALSDHDRRDVLNSTKPLILYYPREDQEHAFLFKIKTEPTVYLVGAMEPQADLDTFFEDEEIVPTKFRFPMHPDPERGADFNGQHLCELGGRLCYDSFSNPRPGGNEAYLQHLIAMAHGSVLEHAVFSFIIAGIDRSCSHELIRHRIGSYSQRSQRFVYEDEPAFIVPARTLRDVVALRHWVHAVATAFQSYQTYVHDLEDRPLFHDIPDKRLRRKTLLDEARSLLPPCVETKIMATWNARALRNIIEQRGSDQAAQPIRTVALKILARLDAEYPHLVADYVIHINDEGEPTSVSTQYRKV